MGAFQKTEGQVAAVIGERLAQARDRERLARRPADQQIEGAMGQCALDKVCGCHVAEIDRLRMARGQYLTRERLDLGAPDPVELWAADLGRSDAGKAGCCAHGHAAQRAKRLDKLSLGRRRIPLGARGGWSTPNP